MAGNDGFKPQVSRYTAAAATRVRHEDPPLWVLVIMLAVFVAASVSTVAGITLLFSVARGGVRARMERFQDWIERDSGAVMSVVLVLVNASEMAFHAKTKPTGHQKLDCKATLHLLACVARLQLDLALNEFLDLRVDPTS